MRIITVGRQGTGAVILAWLLALLLPAIPWDNSSTALAQDPEMQGRFARDAAVPRAPDFGFPKGKTVYVDGTTGKDTLQCGTQTMPCKTINQGIARPAD